MQAKVSATNTDLSSLSTAVDAFQADTGRYPTPAEGLSVLLSAPANGTGWKGPYVNKVPLDPWGNPYRYQFLPGGGTPGYQLVSAGPDSTTGTADDLKLTGPATVPSAGSAQ